MEAPVQLVEFAQWWAAQSARTHREVRRAVVNGTEPAVAGGFGVEFRVVAYPGVWDTERCPYVLAPRSGWRMWLRREAQPYFNPYQGSAAEVAQAIVDGMCDDVFSEDWLRGDVNLWFSPKTTGDEADAIRERAITWRVALVARLREEAQAS